MRYLLILPLPLLLSACAVALAQDQEEEESPQMGCVYFGNLVRHLEREMWGDADPLDHSVYSHIIYYRDTHFPGHERLTDAADALADVLYDVEHPSQWDERRGFDSWKGVAAARQIARLCYYGEYDDSWYASDVIMEYTCAGPRQKFGTGADVNPMHRRYTEALCGIEYDPPYVPWQYEQD